MKLALMGLLGLLAGCVGEPAEPEDSPTLPAVEAPAQLPLSVGASGGQIESVRHRARLVIGAPEAAGEAASPNHHIHLGPAAAAVDRSTSHTAE